MTTSKQQSVIREMADKKLLTSEQKKVLYKLFVSKIDIAIQKNRTLYNQENEKLEETLLKDYKRNSATVQRFMKMLDEADRNEKIAKKGLDEKHLTYTNRWNSGDARRLTIDCLHPILTAKRNEQDNKARDVEGLKVKLLSDIYCLPMTAQEMTDYIDNEINKITI